MDQGLDNLVSAESGGGTSGETSNSLARGPGFVEYALMALGLGGGFASVVSENPSYLLPSAFVTLGGAALVGAGLYTQYRYNLVQKNS